MYNFSGWFGATGKNSYYGWTKMARLVRFFCSKNTSLIPGMISFCSVQFCENFNLHLDSSKIVEQTKISFTFGNGILNYFHENCIHFEWYLVAILFWFGNGEKFTYLCFRFDSDQSNTQGAVASTKAVGGPEFKERAAFNRRRGAMRRRVHQVPFYFK